MSEAKIAQTKKGYVFNVSILVEGYNNGIALEALLNLLNTGKVLDYQINEGIELGKIIDASLAEPHNQQAVSIKKSSHIKENRAPSAAEKTPKPAESRTAQSNSPKASVPEPNYAVNLLKDYQQTNTLVRLSALKGKGVRISLPCRILSFDAESQLITVYHVDEKKVYQFHLNEIEDFHAN